MTVTYRYKKMIGQMAIASGAMFVFFAGIVIFMALDESIVDWTAAEVFLGFAPLFFLIFLAIVLPFKLVWCNGVLQKYCFGKLLWQVDIRRQRIYVLGRLGGEELQFYFTLFYEQDGVVKKHSLQAIDLIMELYLFLHQFSDYSLRMENLHLFKYSIWTGYTYEVDVEWVQARLARKYYRRMR